MATATCGYVALTLEVAWIRTFAMVIGPTTYAFTTTVACFIVGLAAGSGTAAWLLRGRGGLISTTDAIAPAPWLAAALAAGTLAVAWSMGRVDDFVLEVARRTAQPGVMYWRLLVAEFLGAAVLVVPMAISFGAAFPLALALARAASGRQAGWVYAANTAGAIGGALLTPALAIPKLGLRGTFLLAAALMGIMGLALAVRSVRTARALATATVLALAAAVVLSGAARWNVNLLSSGAYKYAAYLGEQDLELQLTAGTLNYYREGATGTVAVREVAGVRNLSIDGKVDASNGGDMLTQRLLAHLPLLLRPGATHVAVVGLGSGVTAGSALAYPIRHLDVVELSPEVVEASTWFAGENRKALEDPRVRLIKGDARTHFRLASSRYDVIISEPSNPWMAGVAALFTREFFEALRSRLTPGGVVCQWAHTYDISGGDLKSIVATFTAVFPHATLFLIGQGDLLLIGSNVEEPFPDAGTPNPANAEVRRDLEAAGVTNPAVLDQFRLGDAASLASWVGTPALQTDDRMALEFTVPEATVGASRENNAAALLRAAPRPDQASAVVLRDAGLLALRAEAPDRAWEFLNRAAPDLPEDRAALEGLVRAAAMSADSSRLHAVELQLRGTVASRPAAVAPRLELARLLASRGQYADARRLALEADQVAPENADVQEELAGIATDAGDATDLAHALERLRALRPGAAATSYFEAVLFMITGHPDKAIPHARAAVAADPRYAQAWNLLGSALGSANGPSDEIRNAFSRAIHADPTDSAAYVNLGTLELSSGRATAAANWFAQALAIDPGNESARKGLAAVRSALD